VIRGVRRIGARSQKAAQTLPGEFIGAVRVSRGEADGLSANWKRGSGGWVRDVFVWSKGSLRLRNILVSRPRGGKVGNRDYVPAAYCVLTPGESAVFQGDAAGLPVRGEAVRRSRIRLFAAARTRNLERCRCNSPTPSSGRSTVSRRPPGHRASRRLQPSPALALQSRFHQPRLAFVRAYPYDRPHRILNSPSNDAE
jgi:hypothetical protein